MASYEWSNRLDTTLLKMYFKGEESSPGYPGLVLQLTCPLMGWLIRSSACSRCPPTSRHRFLAKYPLFPAAELCRTLMEGYQAPHQLAHGLQGRTC